MASPLLIPFWAAFSGKLPSSFLDFIPAHMCLLIITSLKQNCYRRIEADSITTSKY